MPWPPFSFPVCFCQAPAAQGVTKEQPWLWTEGHLLLPISMAQFCSCSLRRVHIETSGDCGRCAGSFPGSFEWLSSSMDGVALLMLHHL